MNTIQKDLDTMRRRREELSKLFKRLYDVIFCERKEWIGIEERSSA